MKSFVPLVATLAALLSAGAMQAQTTVYDTVTPPPTASYSEASTNNLIIGDALNLAQGGQLQVFRFDLFNSSSAGGSIQMGTMNVNFYDNTNPYTTGSLAAHDPLIASVNFGVDLTPVGGLPPGSYTPVISGDLRSMNINLPQNIFITQQFTQTSGTSTGFGTVTSGTDSTVGSSPATIYIKSSAIPEGLYTLNGGTNQIAYAVGIVPEPGSVTLAVCGGLALLGGAFVRRHRQRG
jgi:hypothetical protein